MEYIFSELREIDRSLNPSAKKDFTDAILNCDGKIVGLGAGRMGYSLQAFMMRLSHLGFPAFMIGDTSLPRIGSDDLVIVNSSSGETPSIVLLAEIAKKHGAKILCLTAGVDSSLFKLSNICITYDTFPSSQLMKTAYEQFSYIFFDECALKLAEFGQLEINEIETNHSILE